MAAFVQRLNAAFGAEHFVTDARGHDLVTGAEHADLLNEYASAFGALRRMGSDFTDKAEVGERKRVTLRVAGVTVKVE